MNGISVSYAGSADVFFAVEDNGSEICLTALNLPC